MNENEAIGALQAAGVPEGDAITTVRVAAVMGTARTPDGQTLVVCAAGNYAVETMDMVTEAGAARWRP